MRWDRERGRWVPPSKGETYGKRGGELKYWGRCGESGVHVHESFAFYTLSVLSRNSTMLCFCPRTWLIGGGSGVAGAGGTPGGDDWSGVFEMAQFLEEVCFKTQCYALHVPSFFK